MKAGLFPLDLDPRSSRSFFHTRCVDRELPICRPGQILLTFKFLGVAGGTTESREIVLLPQKILGSNNSAMDQKFIWYFNFITKRL